MAFVTIIEDDNTFEYSPVDSRTGQRVETVFVLRIVPDEEVERMRKAATKRVFENHQPVMRIDELAFGWALLDYAIVDWRGVKSARNGQDIPCTLDMKKKLPDATRGEIVRLCGGKDAGTALATMEEEKKLSAPTLSGRSTSSPA